MTATTTPAVKRDEWRAAFPMDELHRATEFLQNTWEELVTRKAPGFNRQLRENQLTEKLHSYLVRLSEQQGRLIGHWINEDVHADMDDYASDNPQVAKRIRKDITYVTNRVARISLIFEFKKISAKKKSWRAYSGEDGMRRFVDGTYARGQPLAVMVGMLMDDKTICTTGLRAVIDTANSRTELRMVQIDGQWLSRPSTAFPGLAEFDTEHQRPAGEAPAHGTMLLSHMFVSMPPSP